MNKRLLLEKIQHLVLLYDLKTNISRLKELLVRKYLYFKMILMTPFVHVSRLVWSRPSKFHDSNLKCFWWSTSSSSSLSTSTTLELDVWFIVITKWEEVNKKKWINTLNTIHPDLTARHQNMQQLFVYSSQFFHDRSLKLSVFFVALIS